MGMLQLAGAVSGFGQGIQKGLENTQQYMTYSMLQKEREEMEQKRMQLTFGNDLGLLREKFGHENAQLATREAGEDRRLATREEGETSRANMHETGANLRNTNSLQSSERIADIHETGANLRNTNSLQSSERIADTHETGENTRTTQRINASKDEGAAERKNRAELQGNELQFRSTEGDKNRAADLARQRERIGAEIVQHTQTLQSARQNQKLDPGVDRQIDVLMEDLKIQGKRLEAFPTKEEADKIQTRIDGIKNEIRSLTGVSAPQPTKQGGGGEISQVDPYRNQSPLSSPSDQSAAPIQAQPNLTRMGNVEPTDADLAEFKRQYDAASQSGGSIADVVENFKNRFGRVPTQADYDRVR